MIPRRTPRLVARAAVVLAGVSGIVLASAGPALALNERNAPPGHGLTWVETVLIFVGIPFGAAAVISFLVLLPSMVRGPRYRPGRPWTGGAVWFGGPADPSSALSSRDVPSATTEGGGASARW